MVAFGRNFQFFPFLAPSNPCEASVPSVSSVVHSPSAHLRSTQILWPSLRPGQPSRPGGAVRRRQRARVLRGPRRPGAYRRGAAAPVGPGRGGRGLRAGYAGVPDRRDRLRLSCPDLPVPVRRHGAAGCTTWSYNVLQGGRWRYSRIGAQARVVRPGDVDGWAWGPSTVQQGAEPPAAQLRAAVCRAVGAFAGAHPPRRPARRGRRAPCARRRPDCRPPPRPSPSPPPGATARPSPTERAGDTATVLRQHRSRAERAHRVRRVPPTRNRFGPLPATALAQAAKTEFAALVESMPAEPQRMSASEPASIGTQIAEATALAVSTETPTLPAISVVDEQAPAR